jgi:hypothetical protein
MHSLTSQFKLSSEEKNNIQLLKVNKKWPHIDNISELWTPLRYKFKVEGRISLIVIRTSGGRAVPSSVQAGAS